MAAATARKAKTAIAGENALWAIGARRGSVWRNRDVAVVVVVAAIAASDAQRESVQNRNIGACCCASATGANSGSLLAIDNKGGNISGGARAGISSACGMAARIKETASAAALRRAK